MNIGLALTWDGSRWPMKSLPAEARKFLKTHSSVIPSAKKTATLLAGKQVRELRICWVPRLKGGDDVLSAPFPTADGKRMPFRMTQSHLFGDVLGVIYQRK